MALHLKRLLILLLLSVVPLAHADIQRLQNLHEFRSEGYVASTYMLLDNNLFERIREPGHREAYNAAIGNMEQLLRRMGNPNELRAPYDEFVGLVRKLEGQSNEEPHYQLATVNEVMIAHAQMDKAVTIAYEELAKNAPEKLLALHRQSTDISQILLLYQNNMFSSVGIYFVEAEEGMFAKINSRITERSDELHKLFPDMTSTLNQLDHHYSFIRPRLLNHRSDWVPTIAAFYLLRNTGTLNNLSREEARTAS